MQETTQNKSFRIPEGYSAGLMSQSFWFTEFKKTVKLQAGRFHIRRNQKNLCREESLWRGESVPSGTYEWVSHRAFEGYGR